MNNTETQQLQISATPAPSDKRILARVVLQTWAGRKNKEVVFVGEKTVDVTHAILLRDYEFVVELRDAFDQADEIGGEHVDHYGPVEVYVCDSICAFFGVSSLDEITPAAFEEARRAMNPKRPEYVRTVIEVAVTAKVLPGAERNTAFDNLGVRVSSSAEDVIVTRSERLAPSAGRTVVLSAADPALPRFMQLLALANAVSLDDGALLTNWTTDEWIGEPMNEVVRFAWTDGDHDYSDIFTEEGIEGGTFDDNGRFFVQNREGDLVMVKFFMLEQIGLNNPRITH